MHQNDTGNQVPALEKGLDILEVLAQEHGALTQKQLAESVGRTVSEVFRVMNALEDRGYISRDVVSGQYSLTLRLFELSNIHPPMRRLIQTAVPHMENLANEIGSSCHLVTQHGDQMIVLAQAQPDGLLMGWSVRIGGVFPLSETYASARIIAAHQRPERRAELAGKMVLKAGGTETLVARLEGISEAGYEVSQSAIATGVVDVSAPILNHMGTAAAALTVSRIGEAPETDITVITDRLTKCSAEISRAMGAAS